jgi:hypothetical protein
MGRDIPRRVVEHLRLSGFVAMKRPPLGNYSTGPDAPPQK